MKQLFGFSEIEQDRCFEKELPGGVLRFTRLSRPAAIEPFLNLLNEIWGFAENERIPLHEAVVVAMTGGLFLGIEFNGSPAGLVYIMPAFVREWGYHHHSNFLGFKPEYRSLGLGLETKRVHAILAGRDKVKLVTWTFDPLQTANANLNFRKLGCICRTYLPDHYGGMGGTFDPGLPTDRFLVEWRLDTVRVRARLQGKIPGVADLAQRFSATPVLTIEKGPEMAAELFAPEAPRAVRLVIPLGVHEQAARELKPAGETLLKFRHLVRGLFDAGYAVTEMIPAGGGARHHYYVLEKGVE